MVVKWKKLFKITKMLLWIIELDGTLCLVLALLLQNLQAKPLTYNPSLKCCYIAVGIQVCKILKYRSVYIFSEGH